jgi:hypothetical protein
MLIGILTYFEPRVVICINLCQSPGTQAILLSMMLLGLGSSLSGHLRLEEALERQKLTSQHRQLRPRNPTGVSEES